MRRALVLLLVGALFHGALACASPAAPRGEACTMVASPGVKLSGFVNRLRPGDVGCLHQGTYGARGRYTTMSTSGAPSRRITLRGYPGDPKPRILGEFFLTADNVTLSRLLFDGPTGRVERRPHDNPGGEAEQLYLSGRNLEVTRSEVRNNRWHAGIYALNATDARIVGNYIHHNGDFADPARANLDHGIYFASGSGLIADNLITRNYAFGVHLYPSPRNVVVRNNRIFRQGRAGVIIGSEPGEPLPAGNRIVGNVIASNGHRAITSYGELGPGNIVESNRVCANGTAGATRGLTVRRARAAQLPRARGCPNPGR